MKRRLLVFELRMMGDAIMSLPFVRAAQERFEVRAACAPAGREVFQMVLPADRVIDWQPPWLTPRGRDHEPWRRSGWRAFVAQTRAVRADVAVCVWPDARTHILMGLSGAKERVGFPMVAANFYANHLGWRKRQLLFGPLLGAFASVCLTRPLLTRKLVRRDYRQHHIENWRQLAEALELRWDAAPPWLNAPEGGLPADVRSFLDQARQQRRTVWLVHPGARTPNRRWPVENFKRVIAETLRPAGAAVVVVKPPELEWHSDFGEGALVAAPANLAELARLTGSVDRVLCNDTGMAHVAAALGKRTVAVFTANLPEWFAPYGSADLAVASDACPHRPCLDRCVMPSFVCRDAVSVELVAARVKRATGEAGTGVVCELCR